MRTRIALLALSLAVLSVAARCAESPAAKIIESSGVKGGLCVHLGVTDGKLIAELGAGGKFLVHGLAADEARVEKARAFIRSKDLYGRISVERSDMKKLPYAENLVNLVVAEDLGALLGKGLDLKEAFRVLVPKGVLCFGGKADAAKLKAAGFGEVKSSGAWTVATKPRPREMDEWTHPFYGPSCNPVSQDMFVDLPARVRWVDGPRWGRHGSGLGAWVSAGGRVFYVFDPKRYGYPGGRLLVARDAFNGLLLWTRPLLSTFVKNGRRQRLEFSKRHLVAVGDRVYTVLKYRGPLVALDAATGEVVRTYENIKRPGQFVYHDGKLIATQRTVVAVDAASGKELWKSQAGGGYLMLGEGRIFTESYAGHGKHHLTCLDLKTGGKLWEHVAAPRNSVPPFYYKGTVVLSDRKTIDGYSAKDGKKLWSFAANQAMRGGVHSVVYAVRGLVWTHGYFGGKGKHDAKTAWFGLDPETGELKKRFNDRDPKQVIAERHRCCPDHPTERFFLFGTCNFVDTATGKMQGYLGTRTTCSSGFFPANGLLYFSPFACGCANFMRGFRAMAPAAKEKPADFPAVERLKFGPAKGTGAGTAAKGEWSTYRGDARRSAYTATAVSATVGKFWEVDLGGQLSAPVVAGGTVYLASVDGHRVMALDAAGGKVRWSYTAGGRVDTPPTLYGRLLFFGSADGNVYCLRAADGKLVWRFLAAPVDRRIVAFGQLESAWPVHGSVVVVDGIAYVAAGRHTSADGGIAVYALKAADGSVVWKQCVRDLPPKHNFLCDLMVSDGKAVYLADRQFDLKSGANVRWRKAAGFVRGGFSGFLDSDWFNYHNTKGRQRWSDGRGVGKILARGPAVTCGMATDSGRAGSPRPGIGNFKLFGTKGAGDKGWKFPVPVQVRAVAMTGPTLFVAGRRDPDLSKLAAEKDKYRRYQMFAEISDEEVSPPDGLLVAYSAADGKKLSELKLESPPVFDGLAAASGRLYLSCLDGRLRCFGRR